VPREEQGVAAAEERTANPWRFPGQYEDAETGLYYNRFRYYDPGLGRYLSEDPIGLSGGVALFGYVSAPPTWIDPLGLAGCGSQAKPALTDDPWSPAEVAKRQAARLHDNGPLAAEALGFRPTAFRSHGQPVYVSGRRFITPDVDSHIGGRGRWPTHQETWGANRPEWALTTASSTE